MKYHIFILALCLQIPLFGQIFPESNIRSKTIHLSTDTVQIDTLSIEKSSFRVLQGKAPSTHQLDKVNSRFIKRDSSSLTVDSFTISYRVLPLMLSKTWFHKDYHRIELPAFTEYKEFTYNAENSKSNSFITENLNKNGSISRGINFGNNQDLVVNSQLNLQLNGKLSERINILAAIADDNVPIQADGNTQQLQEFDKVFIQLYDKQNKLTVGDYFMIQPKQSYFAMYNKRNQGAIYQGKLQLSDTSKFITIHGAAASSRGRFNRYKLPITEGNQGPYQLRGVDNELFIIVLSGSEKVYLDGKLLSRGLEFDYVIDYNTAQVRFMPKIQITKDRRVFVEFQYSDKNYARSILQGGSEYNGSKTSIFINYYAEQDNKNKPILQSLNQHQIDLMSNVGDSITKAIDYNIDTVTFTTTSILYQQIDSIIEGISYQKIFRYSTNPENAIYRLSFSDVGIGNGNYVQTKSAANGKVFEWIKPINGKPQGQFEPIVLFITPKRKSMLNTGITQKLSKVSYIDTEAAISQNNINTFSTKDHANDHGLGIKSSWKNINLTNETDSTKFHIKTQIIYEFISKNFSAIERYRSVEFDRDWNYTSSSQYEKQHLISANLGFIKTNKIAIDYTINSFKEINNYQGLRHNLKANFHIQNWDINANASLLNARTTADISSFLRHKVTIKKKWNKRIEVGGSNEQEINVFTQNTSGIKTSNTNFQEWQLYSSSLDTSKKWYRLKYTNRTDLGIKQNIFSPLAHAQTYQSEIGINSKNSQQIKSVINFRKLEILDTTLTAIKPENTLLTRQEFNFTLAKGLIVSSNFYEFGSGLESKKEYSYLEVSAGQGLYTWNDYNENGIKELNEFEISVFKDKAGFIRVFTPTNQFVKVYSNQVNQTLIINPSAILRNKKKRLTVFVSKFYIQSILRIERKTGRQFDWSTLNPFYQERDTSLATMNQLFRNTITFNRNNPRYAIEYTYLQNNSTNLLLNGSETKWLEQHNTRIRIALTRKLSTTLDGSLGEKSNESEFFTGRNYQLKTTEASPAIIFQPNVKYRISINYTNKRKVDRLSEINSYVTFHNIMWEMKYSESGKGSLQCKFTFSTILPTLVDVNSPVGFEMMESLQPGKNYLWNVSYQQNLTSNLQLSLTYDGRKSETSRMIHNGGVQVRAIF